MHYFASLSLLPKIVINYEVLPTHSSVYTLDMYEWPLMPPALLQSGSQHLPKLC